LSRQIRALEEDLEVQLFVRNRRNVLLTDAGRLLLREGAVLVSEAGRIADAVRLARKGELGLVRIGMGPALTEKVTRVVVAHSKLFPLVEIHCREMALGSVAQNNCLRDGEIDVGFLRPPIDAVHLDSEILFREPLYVFLGKTHRLAKRKTRYFRLKDLAGEPILLKSRDVSSGVCDKVLELFRRAGVQPNIIEQMPTAPLLVACKGISIGGEGFQSEFSGDIISRPLHEPDALANVSMAWRKGEKSAAVLSFLNTVRKVFPPAR
jgi:DNA-binding transcriptional LysR family regulator